MHMRVTFQCLISLFPHSRWNAWYSLSLRDCITFSIKCVLSFYWAQSCPSIAGRPYDIQRLSTNPCVPLIPFQLCLTAANVQFVSDTHFRMKPTEFAHLNSLLIEMAAFRFVYWYWPFCAASIDSIRVASPVFLVIDRFQTPNLQRESYSKCRSRSSLFTKMQCKYSAFYGNRDSNQLSNENREACLEIGIEIHKIEPLVDLAVPVKTRPSKLWQPLPKLWCWKRKKKTNKQTSSSRPIENQIMK